jgi:hypothetical protein
MSRAKQPVRHQPSSRPYSNAAALAGRPCKTLQIACLCGLLDGTSRGTWASPWVGEKARHILEMREGRSCRGLRRISRDQVGSGVWFVPTSSGRSWPSPVSGRMGKSTAHSWQGPSSYRILYPIWLQNQGPRLGRSCCSLLECSQRTPRPLQSRKSVFYNRVFALRRSG